MTEAPPALRDLAARWFEQLRDRLCQRLEALEDALEGGPATKLPPGRFERQAWRRGADSSNETADCGEGDGAERGGGVMALMRGRVFEKVGVNVSLVQGEFSPAFRRQIPGAATDGRFWAAGISLVAHPRSPLVAATHLNLRHIVTSRGWFGGGADLTPTISDEPGNAAFQQALADACHAHGQDYDHYKSWCDRYFYLPHRQEPRGAGGIFFDELASADPAADFAFVQAVGEAFLAAYPALVERRLNHPWSAEQRQQLLVKRGRYVEFNLLYDRGTTFGLKTGGNVEAILMSLPPEVHWP